MTMNPDTAWVEPGAKGTILDVGGWYSRVVAQVTVDRVTTRDVVVHLDNAPDVTRRFRRADMHEQGKGYRADLLVAANDPQVRRIKAEQNRRTTENAARKACENYQSRRDVDTALEAIRALAATLPAKQRKAIIAAAADPEETP